MIYLVGFLFVGYGLLVGGLYLFQRKLMYHPDQTVATPQSFGLPEMSAERIPTPDGFPLLAWWKAPQHTNAPVLLYLHGNAGHLGERADKLRPYLEAGFGVLLISYRYNAGAGGSPSEEGLMLDGRTALAFLHAKGIQTDRIVLYGESLGTGIAVRLATEKKGYRAVVLETPYSSVADVAAAMYRFVPVRPLLHDHYDSTAVVANIGAPLLVVHGKKDRVIPVRFGQRLYETAIEPKHLVLIDDGHHMDLYDYGMAKEVLDFLADIPPS